MRDLFRRAGVPILALMLVTAPGVFAQGPPGAMPAVPQLFGTFQPVQGAWSEYSVVDKTSGKKSQMKMAIVGKEGDGFWYEVTLVEGEHQNVVKMLVQGNPNDPDNIQRLIMKSGDNPATEMPRDFVAMGRKMAVHMFEKRSGASTTERDGMRVVEVDKRQVTVTAGTFQAVRQKIVDAADSVLATYDFNGDVLPFGVLTSEAEQTSMELLAHGRDARSSITETPRPMQMPPGMLQGMPRGIPPGMMKGQQ